jgi:hypothetical protein
MFESVRNRWLLAIAAAFVVALSINALFSSSNRRAEKSGDAAAVTWKAKTGVDLSALPSVHQNRDDSESARALDALLEPIGLHLGGRLRERRPPSSNFRDHDDLELLREFVRDAVRATSSDLKPLPAAAVAAVERREKALDAAAAFVAEHDDIRWREEMGPRNRSSILYITDHITLHRLLIARGFLALARGDEETAGRMLRTSQKLSRALEGRPELMTNFVAIAAERQQLALIRATGRDLGIPRSKPDDIRARYLAAMSAEAAVILTTARNGAFTGLEDDPSEHVVHAIAGPQLERAASETISAMAPPVAEIVKTPDGCVALARPSPRPPGILSDEFMTFNATEAWRRFVMLELDRAVTTAFLTGRATSPCASVGIGVRDAGATRTVETKGTPGGSEVVTAVPASFTGSPKP